MESADVLDREDAGRRIAGGGVFRFGAYGLGTLFSLLGIVFVTRALGPTEFGTFQSFLNLMVVIGAVTDVGLGTFAVREYAQRPPEERDRFLDVLLGLRVLLSALGALAACAIVAFRGADALTLAAVGALGVALIASTVQSTASAPLFANLRLGVIALIDTTRQALLAAAYVGLALAGAGLAAFLGVAAPIAIVILLATVVLAWRYYRPRMAIDLRSWKAVIAVGGGFALAVSIGTVYQYSAQLVMAATADPLDTGYFATAFRIYIVLSAVPGIFVSGAFPLLARTAISDRARLAYGTRVLGESTVILGAGMALAVVIAAPVVVTVVGGTEYAGAVPATRILGLQLLLAALVSTWGVALFALHQHRQLVIANAIALVPVVFLTPLAAHSAGAAGVAGVVLACEIVLVIGYCISVRRQAPGAMPRWIVVIKVAAAMLAAAPAALLPMDSGVRALVALLVYVIILFMLRALPDEMIDLAPAGIARKLRRA